jgi:hypothetical protein
MKGRFTGNNGFSLYLLVQQAMFQNHSGAGLPLDREKAYDRVNP